MEFVGKVISNRMQKSILVAVDRIVKIPKYNREVRRTTKLMAHDETDTCNIGDTVRIHSCRPRSKRKCWEVTDVLQRTKIYDAEAATRGAVNKLRAVADQGFAASALQSPPPSPPPCA
ncbi:MRPS17 [Auxenochlorella protothecoides x Auxenochlorella symbiontica]